MRSISKPPPGRLPALKPWLESHLAGQLQLANSFLQRDPHCDSREYGSQRPWANLFEDTGSCVLVFDQLSDDNDDDNENQGPGTSSACLRVLATTPKLVLTDGVVLVEATLSSQCQRVPATRVAGLAIRVRKYTLRYTSYGPPRTRLQFYLDACDWCSHGSWEGNISQLIPIAKCQQITQALHALDQTRAQADRRCFRLNPGPQEAKRMATQADESAFGTQLPRNTPKGLHAGTPQASKQASRVSSDHDRAKLVRLLNKVNRPNPIPRSVPTNPSPAKPVDAPPDPEPFTSSEQSPDDEAPSRHRPEVDNSDLMVLENGSDEPQKLPDWMKNVCLMNKAGKVPSDQYSLLLNNDSWNKPTVGYRFPDANIPQKLLQAMAKFHREAMVVQQQAEESDSLPLGESNEDDAVPTVEEDINMDEELQSRTSGMSWSRSPTPNLPKQPFPGVICLPSDSSLPEAQSPGRMEKSTKKSPEQASEQPILLRSSNEMRDVQPPSSPPIIERDHDSDLDMELVVPRGLENHTISNMAINYKITPSSASVQVKETPHVKNKSNILGLSQNPTNETQQPSSGPSKHTSSASIVYCTYQDPTSSNKSSQKKTEATTTNSKDKPGSSVEHAIGPYNRVIDHSHETLHVRSSPAQQDDISMDDAPPEYPHPPEPSRQKRGRLLEPDNTGSDNWSRRHSTLAKSKPLNSKSLNTQTSPVVGRHQSAPSPIRVDKAGSAKSKRKHDDSPSKKNSRHAKRREIKIVDFGRNSPQKDLEEEFRQERKGPIERTMTSRESNSVDHVIDTTRVTAGANQHPTALRLEPSRERITHIDYLMDIDQRSDVREESVILNMHPSPSREPSRLNRSPTQANDSRTIFEKFKLAYPAYSGDNRHFLSMCKQMYALELEDKMVPKWQWDDYLIRNKTAYKEYANQCIDDGEGVEPYHRFYKDSIRDTLFTKSIMDSTQVLLMAMDELGAQPAVTLPHVEQSRFTMNQKPKRSFSSALDQRVQRSISPALFSKLPYPAASARKLESSSSLSSSRVTTPPVEGLAKNSPPNLAQSSSRTKLPWSISPKATTPSNPTKLSDRQFASNSAQTSNVAPKQKVLANDPYRNFVMRKSRVASWTGSTRVRDPDASNDRSN